MQIKVNSLEETEIDGGSPIRFVDAITSENKEECWIAICEWRDSFLTAKAAELQAKDLIIQQKSEQLQEALSNQSQP